MCEQLAKNVARTLALELANMELKNIIKNEKCFEATVGRETPKHHLSDFFVCHIFKF